MDKTDSYNVTAEADQAHDDQWLADQVVALGVGENVNDMYAIDGFHVIGCDAADFVRDWRVTGALLTMVYDAYANIDDMVQSFEGDPRTITEDCVETLS